MYITEMQLIQAKLEAEKRYNDSEILKEIITEDANSQRKREMREGERYYCCEHDVVQKNFAVRAFSETRQREDGTEEEGVKLISNPNRSNHHTISPFHHILVEQKVTYLVGKEPSILLTKDAGEDMKEYEKDIVALADEVFNRTLYEWIVGASNKGVEYLHIYYDKEGQLQYCIVPAEQIIVFYDSVYEKEIEQVIRYYDFTVIHKGKEQTLRKVEWWTKEDVTYYTEKSDGSYERENQQKIGHWRIVEEEEMYSQEHGWGRVPFIPLRNNNKELSDLKLIKGLIDAYDLLCSEGTNQLLDLVELYWVIAGYGGETANTIAKKLQINRAVHISDASGKVEAKQVDLPIEGRLQWLKFLRKDIFHFGMGVDTDNENLGNAPSGVSLKFQYAMFHLKVNSIIPEIKRALKDFFWFLTEDYNRKKETNYDYKKIDFQLNVTSITDDMEMMNMITASRGIVSEKTLLAHHPFVQDVNSELQAVKEERKGKEEYDQKYAIGNGDNRTTGRNDFTAAVQRRRGKRKSDTAGSRKTTNTGNV